MVTHEWRGALSNMSNMVKTTRPESRDEVLTLQEVAAWLKVRPRQVLRLGIPCIDLGHKTKRFLAEDVRAWLERRRG
jgi:hypothetical protein